MIEATFVLFARKAQLERMRAFLKRQAGDIVRWKERRRLFGSEFYVSGPVTEARLAHEAAARDLMRFDGPT